MKFETIVDGISERTVIRTLSYKIFAQNIGNLISQKT